MSTLLELAKNKARVRAAAKELNVAQLENLIAGFTNALEKAKQQQQARETKNAEKVARAEEIATLIAKSGLTMEEVVLLSASKFNAKKSKTVEPKYRLTVHGKIHEWTGRGRIPKVFQEYFDAGNSRERIEIK